MARKQRKQKDSNTGREKTSAPGSDSKIQNPFNDTDILQGNKIFIECPGATIYKPGTREIIAGVRFYDENDPSKGYEIIGNPVYAPEHNRHRLVKKENKNSIRRCQACQDLTVRMIRKEGVDFFIPSPKHPRKNHLKSVENTWQKDQPIQ